MSVLETIAERRSIFDFEPTAVPRERIERALQAAVWAPNHKLTEPWRFIVVGPGCKRRLGEVYARIKQEAVPVDITAEALREIGRKAVKKLMGKPTVMAVTCAVSGDPMLDREDYAATCCAIQNILLAAWEDGIGMQWSTSGLIEDAEALSVLGVDPEREQVVGLLYAGFADRVPASQRKPAAELTTWLEVPPHMTATTPIGLPVAELDTPALLVDLDLLDRNIERIASVVIDDAGIGWRPHTKGLKTPALAHRLIARGAMGVTCAKLGEAEVMASAGIRDILVANQVVGPTKVRRLAHLCRGGADVVVAVDSEVGVRQIGAAATAAGSEVRVVVELNIGMDRAGVAPGEEAVRMARIAADTPGVRLAGLMAWEGHTLGIEPIEAKRQAIETAVGLLTGSAERCRAAGLPIDIVSCGGTGSYWITARQPGVTEIQAGGGVLGDAMYRQRFGVDHDCALRIAATVTSRPTERRVICDAGRKTMSVEPTTPQVQGLAVTDAKFSAEHGSLTLAEPSAQPGVGDRLEFIAGYSDTTVFLHDTINATRDGVVEAVWPLLGRGRLT